MRRPGSLAAYTAAHFSVDLCCAWSMLRAGAATGQTLIILVFYHRLAFGLQAFFGMFLDRKPGMYQNAAILGCFMTAAGVILTNVSAPGAVAFCGLGNALFHVGGGVEALRRQPGMGRSGVFVSAGAVGLAIGILWGNGGTVGAPLPLGVLLIAAGGVMLSGKPDGEDAPRKKPGPETVAPWVTAALCSVSIAIRSYVGFAAPMPWKSGTVLVLSAACCAALGKALGGVLADKFGPVRVGVFSLLLSAPLLAFGGGSAVWGLLGLVLFNMTMAVTLCLTADRMPGQEGAVFGLTTLALLAGYFLRMGLGDVPGWGIGLLILISAVCLWRAEPGRWRS